MCVAVRLTSNPQSTSSTRISPSASSSSSINSPGGGPQVSNAFGGSHQQRSGAAGGVADAKRRHEVRVRPVAVLFPQRQRRQQGGSGRGRVERAVVAGGVQHAMEDAAQQVVAQAGDSLGDVRHNPGESAHRLARVRVCRQRGQRRAARLEDWAVINCEYAAPRLAECWQSVSAR